MIDCKEPAGQASGDGLGRFCRRHLEHHRRHGDPLKSSYTAAQLRPLRSASKKWLQESGDDPYVKHSLRKVAGLMSSAGAVVEVRDLARQPADVKARAVMARLRERKLSADRILTTLLAVAMAYEADPQSAKKEFLRVQVGKALLRLAGGQVKRWETHRADASKAGERVLRWFLASEGLVLRVVGQQALDAAEFLIPDRLPDIFALQRRRAVEAAMNTPPFPRGKSNG